MVSQSVYVAGYYNGSGDYKHCDLRRTFVNAWSLLNDCRHITSDMNTTTHYLFRFTAFLFINYKNRTNIENVDSLQQQKVE